MKISELIESLKNFQESYGKDIEVKLDLYDPKRYDEPEYQDIESIGSSKDGKKQIITIGNHIN